MRIYVDASAIVSLYNLDDSQHNKALRLFQRYKDGDFLVSRYSFAEIVTILSQRANRKTATTVGEHIKNTYYWIELDQELEDLSWEIFQKQTSKNVSFIDCTIFALYQKGQFDKCFSFDADFKDQVPLLK